MLLCGRRWLLLLLWRWRMPLGCIRLLWSWLTHVCDSGLPGMLRVVMLLLLLLMHLLLLHCVKLLLLLLLLQMQLLLSGRSRI